MKKGVPLELFQKVKAGDLAPDADVFLLVAGQGEAMRDGNDVQAVILERDITGTFIPMRRAGEPIQRVVQTVTAFVIPKSDDLVYKEESTEKSEEAPAKTSSNGKKK
jgi:hypothetical protein